MGESLIIIQQGAPTPAAETVTFLGTGSEGDPTTPRRLVFPSNVTPLLAPIVYQVGSGPNTLNPAITFNFDKEPLPHPITTAARTLGTTRVISFDENEDDVIVTEVWPSPQGASMPTSLFRLFYEYLVNQPDFSLTGTDFVTWEPRDRTDRVWNVQILSLSVGGGENERRFLIDDVRDPGGSEIDNGLADLNTTPTGLLTGEVSLRMRIVSEVV